MTTVTNTNRPDHNARLDFRFILFALDLTRGMYQSVIKSFRLFD
jgi:hypothetical protein